MTEEIALWCSILASDRAQAEPTIELPYPNHPECNALFLALWGAFRHVTTEFGRAIMRDLKMREHDNDRLEAYVHGKQIPAHVRWAETEAMIRAGEWRPAA